MKKQILSMGSALNKAEQKTISGGGPPGGCGSNYGTLCTAFWALPIETQMCVDVDACCECHPGNPDYYPYTAQYCAQTNGYC